MTFRYFALGLLALAGPALYADPMVEYTAFVGCTRACSVTVSLEWQNLSSPVYFAEVDDDLGNFLFGLNVPSNPYESTGAILPDPQTVSGLTSQDVSDITNDSVFSDSLAFGLAPAALGTYAFLNLDNINHMPIFTERFIATAVPEPTAFALFGTVIGLLFLLGPIRRRKLQNLS